MKKIALLILLLTGLFITSNTQAKSKAPLSGSSDLTTGSYEIAFDRTKSTSWRHRT